MTVSPHIRDTIFALSSAPGRAGVSVFRVSGPETQKIIELITDRPAPSLRKASYRLFKHSKDTIDAGLLLWMPGPGSFTGEDTAEFQTHGSPAVIEAMADAFLASGARQAEAGEFTRRAFENGRMDLTESEGLADLIDAETEGQRKQALRQMQGGLKDTYESWREGLLDALAAIEGEIDFPDEDDVPDALSHKAGPDIDAVIMLMETALEDASRGEHVRHGLDIAIIGPPNAGKSTLLNALTHKDAAIVSAEAGTTRDIVEVNMVLAALPVRISDTAGLRVTDNVIEAEGVRRARTRGAEADIRIGVLDNSDPESIKSALPALLRDLRADDILVFNKSDIAGTPQEISRGGLTLFAMSANNTKDIDDLRDHLGTLIRTRYGIAETAGLTRARHRDCTKRAVEALRRGRANLSVAPELAGDDMRAALHAIKELAGEADIEAVLDRIFSRFCIGK